MNWYCRPFTAYGYFAAIVVVYRDGPCFRFSPPKSHPCPDIGRDRVDVGGPVHSRLETEMVNFAAIDANAQTTHPVVIDF